MARQTWATCTVRNVECSRPMNYGKKKEPRAPELAPFNPIQSKFPWQSVFGA